MWYCAQVCNPLRDTGPWRGRRYLQVWIAFSAAVMPDSEYS